jgi:ribosome-binding factor A
MESHRNERFAEALRQELEEIVNYELSDPRIGEVAITEVLIGPSHKQARVRVSLAESSQPALAALNGARHHIRRILTARLDTYRVPDLEFESDIEVESRGDIKSLLRKVRKGRPRDQEPE